MKKEYDLSKMKSHANLYAAELLKQERATILKGIEKGEIAVSEDRILTQLQAEEKLARWLNK